MPKKGGKIFNPRTRRMVQQDGCAGKMIQFYESGGGGGGGGNSAAQATRKSSARKRRSSRSRREQKQNQKQKPDGNKVLTLKQQQSLVKNSGFSIRKLAVGFIRGPGLQTGLYKFRGSKPYALLFNATRNMVEEALRAAQRRKAAPTTPATHVKRSEERWEDEEEEEHSDDYDEELVGPTANDILLERQQAAARGSGFTVRELPTPFIRGFGLQSGLYKGQGEALYARFYRADGATVAKAIEQVKKLKRAPSRPFVFLPRA